MEELFGSEAGWIERKLGIQTRYWSYDPATGRALPGCLNSELAARAATDALNNAGASLEHVDLLVTATASPDYALPANAPLIQEHLGISKCAAIDVRGACTGGIQALFIAANAIATGASELACVIASETPSLQINLEPAATYTDRTDFINAAMFGDGAGAIILCSNDFAGSHKPELRSIRLGSIGTNRPAGIWLGASGSAEPLSDAVVRDGAHRLRQDYRRILELGLELYLVGIGEVLAAENAQLSDISLGIPHQANGRLHECATGQSDTWVDRFYVNADRVGNCGAASIFIALDEAVRVHPPKKGDLVVLAAAEASKWLYGAAALRW